MLLSKVVVASRILQNGKFPVREYKQPPQGETKFMWCIQYRTPYNMNPPTAEADGDSYDYE